jgi:hypothetical protein
MRIPAALTLIAIGAILAFAVNAELPYFSFHVTGWVLITTGVIGGLLRRRGYNWLRRRLVVSGNGHQHAVEQRQRAYSRLLVRGGLMAAADRPPREEQPIERETIEQIIEE